MGSFIRDVVRLLTAWLRLRSAMVWVCILLLCGALDFSQRVWVGRDDRLRRFEPPAVPQLNAAVAPTVVAQSLSAWFPVIEVAAQEQAKTLTLQGVLGQRGVERAIITVSRADGTFEERKLVAVGGVVAGWTVQRISRAVVSLSRDAQTLEITMFPGRAGGKRP